MILWSINTESAVHWCTDGHLATSEMWCWSGGRGILKKLSLCYCIVYWYNGTQRYEQFLQVGRLYQASILLGLHVSSERLCIFDLHDAIYIEYFFWLHLYVLVSWAWWDWPLTWLTNHRPSVLWHRWLGHLTRKIISEMTYNVSSGTLNPTIPTQTCMKS